MRAGSFAIRFATETPFLRMISRIDPLVRLIALALILASFLPVRGEGRDIAQAISSGAIFILFFLNGVRLPRAEVIRSIGNWRLLLPLTLFVFGVMTMAGWGMMLLTDGFVPPLVALGFLYLGTLPSTVQSATAYSSLAGGNVATSVVAAALLNVLGVFITAPLFSAITGGAGGAMGNDGLIKVFAILLLPFALGQIAQTMLGGWARDHRALVTWMDRSSIAIAVYVAFSGAVEEGIWHRLGAGEWVLLLAAAFVMLAFAVVAAWLLGGALRLERPNRISFLYAGAQKSIAMGAPLAAVLFPHGVAGMVLLPVLVYHMAQLIVSAPLATRLRKSL